MAEFLDETIAPERLFATALVHRAARLVPAAGARTARGLVVAPQVADAARRLGLAVTDAADDRGAAVGAPRVALFCGPAIGYPYYAYYLHCLLALGLPAVPIDGPAVAGGALDGFDMLAMPGGFATWGLDRAEDVEGVDAAIRAFLGRGGAFLGSCGGAFYLSEGRPHWLGLVDAKPKYTHEYLQTGAGIVNVRLDPALGRLLPSTVELAYYHGPAYPPDEGRRAATLATFADLAMPSRLFIDNPLQRDRFERDLKGAPAALEAEQASGRAIAFSPHPEMGDFVRKGIALDGYVRRYGPIRGEKTMDETLRFYGTEDCLSFRLVLNALDRLGPFPARPLPAAEPPDLLPHLDALDAALPAAVEAAVEDAARVETPGMAALLRAELARRAAEWGAVSGELRTSLAQAPPDPELVAGLARALSDAVAALGREAAPVQALVLIELPVRLVAAAARILRCDAALEEAA